jgi:hypothetical protein
LTGFSKISGDVIEVIAGSGPTARTFHVHKAVLAGIAFFQNAMKTEWTNEDTKKPIDLSDEHPGSVETYLNWIYFRHIPAIDDEVYLPLAQLYVLGNKLMHDEFQNAVVDAIIEASVRIKKAPGTRPTSLIYAGTVEGSAARRLLVDMYLWWVDETYMHKYFDLYPSEFLRDYMCALLRLKKKANLRSEPWFTNRKSYHLVAESNSSENKAR